MRDPLLTLSSEVRASYDELWIMSSVTSSALLLLSAAERSVTSPASRRFHARRRLRARGAGKRAEGGVLPCSATRGAQRADNNNK